MAKQIETAENEEDYYEGSTMMNFQSGSPDQPTDRVQKLFQNLIIGLHKEKIRTYTNFQIGKPGGGGCPPGGCQ